MKERPIIMTSESVKAILAGAKTQTRRVIKPQPELCDHLRVFGDKDPQSQKPTEFYEAYPGEWACRICGKGLKAIAEFDMQGIRCPYGQVGDRLWVWETWAVEYVYDNHLPRDIPHRARVYYKTQDLRGIAFVGKWRPSIFMPRWASRITLEITEVKVERLQEVTYGDCMKEGLDMSDFDYRPGWDVFKFKNLWDSINAKRGYGWEVNPWVWVISFKAVK